MTSRNQFCWRSKVLPDRSSSIRASSTGHRSSRCRTSSRTPSAVCYEIAVLSGHTDTVTGAAVFPDGSRVVTASEDNTARVWDLEKRTQLLRLDHAKLVLAGRK